MSKKGYWAKTDNLFFQITLGPISEACHCPILHKIQNDYN